MLGAKLKFNRPPRCLRRGKVINPEGKSEKKHFDVDLFSRVTFKTTLLVLAVNKEEATKKAWRWINRHGFRMFIVK